MAKANGICAALTSASRNWLARSLSAGLRRGDDSLPVIDIQTLNMLAHPKYRPPVATHISVVSPGQAKLAHAWFGMNRHQVHINGALQDDALFAGVAEIDKATVRRDLRISDDARVITLISQLKPMEGRMLPLASALAARLEKDPPAHLVVRLPPRETHGRVDQYKMHFQDRGLGERVSFSRTESVEAVLAVTDTCTTIYSSMAREAVTVGCPGVLAGFLRLGTALAAGPGRFRVLGADFRSVPYPDRRRSQQARIRYGRRQSSRPQDRRIPPAGYGHRGCRCPPTGYQLSHVQTASAYGTV